MFVRYLFNIAGWNGNYFSFACLMYMQLYKTIYIVLLKFQALNTIIYEKQHDISCISFLFEAPDQLFLKFNLLLVVGFCIIKILERN